MTLGGPASLPKSSWESGSFAVLAVDFCSGWSGGYLASPVFAVCQVSYYCTSDNSEVVIENGWNYLLAQPVAYNLDDVAYSPFTNGYYSGNSARLVVYLGAGNGYGIYDGQIALDGTTGLMSFQAGGYFTQDSVVGSDYMPAGDCSTPPGWAVELAIP